MGAYPPDSLIIKDLPVESSQYNTLQPGNEVRSSVMLPPLLSPPVVGGGHGDAWVYVPQVRDHHYGGAVVAGDRAPGQDDIALQPAAVELEALRPEDELHVALLVLDGDEHRALPPLGVLAGDGPASHQRLRALPQLADCRGGQHLAAQFGTDKLHQVALGVDAHDLVLSGHLLVGGEVGQFRGVSLQRHRQRGLAVAPGAGGEARVSQSRPAVAGDVSMAPGKWCSVALVAAVSVHTPHAKW